jgi:hypothetical protein
MQLPPSTPVFFTDHYDVYSIVGTNVFLVDVHLLNRLSSVSCSCSAKVSFNMFVDCCVTYGSGDGIVIQSVNGGTVGIATAPYSQHSR